MKAILVIDVDNIDDIENTQATYIVLRNNNHTYQMSLMNHWLKPMPEKENEFDKCLNDYDRGWRIGYNQCIDELLGEQE